jgi:hypothetical protein
MYKEAIEQLTQERITLNSIEEKIKMMIDKKISSRPETTLSYRAVQLATMWLGKAKGQLGSQHPYPDSYNPASKVIEDRADVAELIKSLHGDELTLVKTIRAELKEMEADIANDAQIFTDKPAYQHCIANAWTKCCEGTMWLGMVLNQMKKEETPATTKKESKPAKEKKLSVSGGKSSNAKKSSKSEKTETDKSKETKAADDKSAKKETTTDK